MGFENWSSFFNPCLVVFGNHYTNTFSARPLEKKEAVIKQVFLVRIFEKTSPHDKMLYVNSIDGD